MGSRADITAAAARELVGVLQGENDIVRIVDPESREVLFWPGAEQGACSLSECNAVWGRSERCSNCTSLEAARLMRRMFKMEVSNGRLFWVRSRPLIIDGRLRVLETVDDVTDGFMVEGGSRDEVADLIGSLNSLVVTDPLTGLLNRRFLDEFTMRFEEFGRAGLRVNVAMIDLDDMKDINDSFGHLAGDAVLRDVAGFLRLNFAEAGGGAHERHAVRYGGDEFLAIDVGSAAGAFEREVRDCYGNMRQVCYFGGMEVPFSLSVGVASSDDCGWDWDAMLDAADRRMYAEKQARDRKVTLPV